MANDGTALVQMLMSAAERHTDHPGTAAVALIVAAGEILQRDLGMAGAIRIMRVTVDGTEAHFMNQLDRSAGNRDTRH